MTLFKKILLTSAVLVLPVSALAQAAAPPEPPRKEGRMKMGHGGEMGGMRLRDMMAKLSPEGRKIMADAVKAQMQQGMANREKLRTVREKILAAMSADKFDASALKRAFAEERALSGDAQEQRHDALANAMAKLSPTDRQSLVAGMREARDRAQQRMMQGKGPGLGDGDMMTPPPPAN